MFVLKYGVWNNIVGKLKDSKNESKQRKKKFIIKIKLESKARILNSLKQILKVT